MSSVAVLDEEQVAFLRDWSKGKPIVAAGSDTMSAVSGDWYRCGAWSVRLWPATVRALLEEGLADGSPDRFRLRR